MNDAKQITSALRGHWYGAYGLACCPAHLDCKPSMSLSNGSEGRLLLYCHSGCSFTDILDALRGLELVEGCGKAPKMNLTDIKHGEAKKQAEAEKKAKQAHVVWRESLAIKDTPAEAYLRRRGITCTLPHTLKFNPECWHPLAKRLPAMVAIIEGAERLAVHRTYLRPDGSDKAEIEPAKAMLGATAKGAVRLVQGVGPLIVAEGIETALSLASGLVCGSSSVWAALSAPGMKALRLREIQRRGLRGLQKAKQIETALDVLEQADWLRREREETKGRPRTFYIANPKL